MYVKPANILSPQSHLRHWAQVNSRVAWQQARRSRRCILCVQSSRSISTSAFSSRRMMKLRQKIFGGFGSDRAGVDPAERVAAADRSRAPARRGAELPPLWSALGGSPARKLCTAFPGRNEMTHDAYDALSVPSFSANDCYVTYILLGVSTEKCVMCVTASYSHGKEIKIINGSAIMTRGAV
jgi:hypothetical protein